MDDLWSVYGLIQLLQREQRAQTIRITTQTVEKHIAVLDAATLIQGSILTDETGYDENNIVKHARLNNLANRSASTIRQTLN